MGIEIKQLGFRATFGKKDKFNFNAEHDRQIIAGTLGGTSSRALTQLIGCSISQVDARREALKRYGFLVRSAEGSWSAGNGVKVAPLPKLSIQDKPIASRYGKDGNTFRPGKGKVWDDTPDRNAPAPERDPLTGALVTTATVRDGQCRWPCGDPQSPGFHLCGNQAGNLYCDYHTRRARQPAAIREAAI